jgi:hypothetical protein
VTSIVENKSGEAIAVDKTLKAKLSIEVTG